MVGRWYGIIAYGISEPTAPAFAFYLNNRNFALDPLDVCESGEPKSGECAAVGDIETESLLFIPASESPNGNPLLVATHEQTDSLTLIELEPQQGSQPGHAQAQTSECTSTTFGPSSSSALRTASGLCLITRR